MLLDLLDHALEIGIACSKAPREPVPTTLGNLLAVYDYVKLSGLTRDKDGFHFQTLLDDSRETRDLRLIAMSRRAVNDLNFHSVPQSVLCKCDIHLASKSYQRKCTAHLFDLASWFYESIPLVDHRLLSCLKRRTSTSAEALPSVLLGNLVLVLCQFPPSPHRSVSCLTHITNFEMGPEVSISRSGWHSAIDGIRRVGVEIN
jgi:hypothetical protein